MLDQGRSCLILERRPHIGGNIYTEEVSGIQVHRYGAHIFHTNDSRVWEYVNRFAEFNRFTNSPVANYHDELYNLPFNMNTFYEMWGVRTPEEAKAKIEEQRRSHYSEHPKNLEEQAINLVGTDIYEKLIKGYTEKQWGRPCTELPAFIIRRLPVRFTYDNNYFNARYQGIPVGGYTRMIENMLQGAEIRLGTDYLEDREYWDSQAKHVFYTGAIDAFYSESLGPLEFRSLRFETEVLNEQNHQGNAVINYTDAETPYTRIIEHKHFEQLNGQLTEPDPQSGPKTVITREYSVPWEPGMEAYYPVNDARNKDLYDRYRALAERESKVLFGGRLGLYRYMDMDVAVSEALKLAEKF